MTNYKRQEYIKLLSNRLISSKEKLSLCESCTGGLLSKILTDTPGSSEWFEGSIISYSNALKTRIGVNDETLLKHGAVSENTAIEMAKNTKDLINSSLCVSITGIAGPEGGSDEKPVGLVYFCFYKSEFNYKIFCKNFNGDRLSIREQAADEAIKIVVDNF